MWQRPYVACKAQTIYYLTLYRKKKLQAPGTLAEDTMKIL